MSDSGISWAMWKKSVPHPRQLTAPAPHHSVFYSPDALPVAQPTVLKHWRLLIAYITFSPHLSFDKHNWGLNRSSLYTHLFDIWKCYMGPLFWNRCILGVVCHTVFNYDFDIVFVGTPVVDLMKALLLICRHYLTVYIFSDISLYFQT